jgi:hypothetical protein
MPEHPLDNDEGDAGKQEEARRGVPEVMKAERPDLGLGPEFPAVFRAAAELAIGRWHPIPATLGSADMDVAGRETRPSHRSAENAL